MLRETFFRFFCQSASVKKIGFFFGCIALWSSDVTAAPPAKAINPLPHYKGVPLYYWQQQKFVNFGDYLSLLIVERIVGTPVKVHQNYPWNKGKKLLALGSIMSFAKDHDAVWGTGVNGKLLRKESYHFDALDVRAVRRPLTRDFLWEHFGIDAPEIYGDPALLFPRLFPEFTRSNHPKYPYIIIPHYSEQVLFPKESGDHIVYPTDDWDVVIRKILDSEFVISSSLHGIILAEAYGIPARQLRITENEPQFKYRDYYFGTNRFDCQYARSVEEALAMGGERGVECDLNRLYRAFPFDLWPETSIRDDLFE